MSKLTEQLKTIGVHNPYEFAGQGNVYIDYVSGEPHAMRYPKWTVARPGFKTDPSAHWMDYGNKAFSCGRADRAAKLEDAKKWASARYHISEWARTPFGSWMDAGFVQARMAELKEMLKAKAEEAARSTPPASR